MQRKPVLSEAEQFLDAAIRWFLKQILAGSSSVMKEIIARSILD